jgi:hypothetical protein
MWSNLRGQADQVAVLTLAQYGTQPNTVFSAFDGLGYAFLSLACLFAARYSEASSRALDSLDVVGTGVMRVPTILTYFVNPGFLWLTLPWSITVPAFSAQLAIYSNGCRRQSNWRCCYVDSVPHAHCWSSYPLARRAARVRCALGCLHAWRASLADELGRHTCRDQHVAAG